MARLRGWSVCVALAFAGCEAEQGGGEATPPPDAGAPAVAAKTLPASEFSGTSLRLPVDVAAFAATIEPLFEAAATPDGEAEVALAPGFTFVARPDARTPEQFVLAVRLDPVVGAEPLELLAVPGSRAYARLFLEAAAQAVRADGAERAAGRTPETWRVGWQVSSGRGGDVRVEVGADGGETTLRLELGTPRVSLDPERAGEPAFDAAPRETVAALVPFRLDYANFRAGITAALGGGGLGAGPDGACGEGALTDAMAPHDWYRLCFRPKDDLAQAGEAVIHVRDRGGRDLPVALAPGSLRSVALWIATLDRLIGNVQTGATRNFESRYDYRDPDRRGTAVIVARAVDGRVSISHSFETPPSVLQDVGFVPVPDFTPGVDPPTPCEAVGGEPGDRGVFVVRFAAAEGLRRFGDLPWPPRGDLYGAVYRASDFGLTGPNEGAVALQTFELPDVELGTDPGEQVFETIELPAGDYKLTGFLDLDGDSAPGEAVPEKGDPAILPLSPVTLDCTRQPLTLEFAVLIP